MIGINTAIRANAAGIGFAIPIDVAEKAMTELAQGKKIAHAFLGGCGLWLRGISALSVEWGREWGGECGCGRWEWLW